MNTDLLQISCLIICGFLFGLLCSAAFHIHTTEFAEQTKASCVNKGFYNIEENLELKQKYFECGERLASSDLNLFYCEKYCKKGC
jgi:hypothetical protein